MWDVRARIGSMEIEVDQVGTIHIKLTLSNLQQLVDFIRALSMAQRLSGPAEDRTQTGATTATVPARHGKEATTHRPVDVVEEKINRLIKIDREIIDLLDHRKKRKTMEPKIPSPGTRYNNLLQELLQRFGTGSFQSNQVAEGQRHILSILHNKYNALKVVQRRGRTNIYRIQEEIARTMLAADGTSTVIEIKGRSREKCDAFMERAKERHPGFTYAFLETRGLRQRYRLFFRDKASRLSVTSALGRFVGRRTNLILQEA